MPVVDNQALKSFDLPGLNHRTFAGPEHGLKNLEVWGQVIAPGSGTPVHRHACEEAIVVLGRLRHLDRQRSGHPLRPQFHPRDSGRRHPSNRQ